MNFRSASRLFAAAAVFSLFATPGFSRDPGNWTCQTKEEIEQKVTNPNTHFSPDNPAYKDDAANHPDTPPNIDQLKEWLRDYRYCGNYNTALTAKIDEARKYISAHFKDRPNPAIVLDVDETSLNNWIRIEEDDFGYVPGGACPIPTTTGCGDREWELSARAEALEPTLQLYKEVKALNIAVFFVTGRYNYPDLLDATTRNLKAVGFTSWDGLILRPIDSNSARNFKKSTRDQLSQKYFIVANIGDQWSDLDSTPDHPIDNQFKLPNPFYFIK